MREVLMLLSFKQNFKMAKLVNALYRQADIFLFLSILTFILRPNGSDLFLLQLGICLVLYLINKKSINLRINKFVYLIWLSLGILFLSLISRYFSFSFHHLDLGIYHNMIINLVTNGSYFDDMNQIHGFGIHFEPLFVIIFYPFYYLLISSYWLILLKFFAIFSFFIIIYQKRIIDKDVFFFGSIIMICLHPHYISVLRWEFHLTNLSPFFIASAYIFYHEKKFISVTIISLIAMTLKENAGVIGMGFGLLMITSKDSRFNGIILFSVSLIYMPIARFLIVPYYLENNQITASNIILFQGLSNKLIFSILVYLPFLFLPLLNWRWFLLTIPALGINLIGKPEMYSGNFHYGDMLIPLATLATFENLQKYKEKMILVLEKNRILIIVPVVCILFNMPASLSQMMVRYFPSEKDRIATGEIFSFLRENPGEKISISSNISPLVERGNIKIFSDDYKCEIKTESKFIITYDKSFRDQDKLLSCINKIESNIFWKKRSDFKHALIFERS